MSSSALRAQRRKLRKEKLNKSFAPTNSGLLNTKQRQHSEQSENNKREKEIWGSSRPNPCLRYYNGFNDGLSDTEIIKCIRQKNVRRFRPAIY